MLVLGVVAVMVVAAPPKDPAFKEQMAEAIRRHDGGDYTGAISIYKSLLTEHPHEPGVVYELALSMQVSQAPVDEQIAFIEKEFKSKVTQLPQLYATLASAYDTKGDTAKGEATLRKGLKVDSKNPDLQYNLGINLMFQKRPKEAEAPFMRATELAPAWPSPWRALGLTLEENGKRLDAFLARARFIVMQPNTPTGQSAAKSMWPLLMAGVSKDGEKKINVNMANTEDLALSLAAATAFTKKESDGVFFVGVFTQMVEYGAEKTSSAYRRRVTDFFMAAKDAGALEAMGWEIRRSAGDSEASTWFGTHPTEEDALMRFMRPRQR